MTYASSYFSTFYRLATTAAVIFSLPLSAVPAAITIILTYCFPWQNIRKNPLNKAYLHCYVHTLLHLICNKCLIVFLMLSFYCFEDTLKVSTFSNPASIHRSTYALLANICTLPFISKQYYSLRY